MHAGQHSKTLGQNYVSILNDFSIPLPDSKKITAEIKIYGDHVFELIISVNYI